MGKDAQWMGKDAQWMDEGSGMAGGRVMIGSR